MIVEFEREQRFDWEQKNEMLILQMNNTKISLMNAEDKVKQQQETIRQQLESLQAKDDLLEQHSRKVTTLEEGMKGLKSNFDDTYRQFHEGKAQLDTAENEKELYLQKLSTSKQELAQARETISDIFTAIYFCHWLFYNTKIWRLGYLNTKNLWKWNRLIDATWKHKWTSCKSTIGDLFSK